MASFSNKINRLNAYYQFIHPYFPILPPASDLPCPDSPLEIDQPPEEEVHLLYRPKSPLSLAISSVLALIPHPKDTAATSAASVLRRRAYANKLAQLANAEVEDDCELFSSSVDPAQALSGGLPSVDREPFHNQTPVELESILTLLVLSVYEYAQRGNLLKMKSRASQALGIALGKSLHSLGKEEDEFTEAKRRAWWMTVCVECYDCIVSRALTVTVLLCPPMLHC